jgi:hypothetical protein
VGLAPEASSVEWSKLQGKDSKIMEGEVDKFSHPTEKIFLDFVLGIFAQYESSLFNRGERLR